MHACWISSWVGDTQSWRHVCNSVHTGLSPKTNLPKAQKTTMEHHNTACLNKGPFSNYEFWAFMCRGLHVQGLALPTGQGPLLHIRIKVAHMFHTLPLPSPFASMPFGEQLQSLQLQSWNKSTTGQVKKQSIKHQAGWRVTEGTCVRSMTCQPPPCPIPQSEPKN